MPDTKKWLNYFKITPVSIDVYSAYLTNDFHFDTYRFFNIGQLLLRVHRLVKARILLPLNRLSEAKSMLQHSFKVDAINRSSLCAPAT